MQPRGMPLEAIHVYTQRFHWEKTHYYPGAELIPCCACCDPFASDAPAEKPHRLIQELIQAR